MAQNTAEIDSLESVLDTISEKYDRAFIARRLHELIMFSDPDKARDYAEMGLIISQEIEYHKGIAIGYMQIGNYFINRNELDSAAFYNLKSLSIYKAVGSIRGQIFANYILSDIQRSRGNYDSAIAIVNANIDLYAEGEKGESDLGNFNLIGAEYNLLGAIYMDRGSYRLALRETLKAARFFAEIEDRVREADALKQIGDIEYALGNYQSSLSYCNQAFAIYGDFDDKVYQAYALNAAGLAAEALGDYDVALDYHDRAIAFSREVGVKSVQSSALKDIGRIHISQKRYKQALVVLEEALGIAREIDVKLDIASALLESARALRSVGATNQALSKLNEMIEIVEPIGASSLLSSAFMIRSGIYQDIGNVSLSLLDYQRFHELHDSIYNEKKSQQIAEWQTIYETEKKESEIALQEQKIQALNQEVKISTLQKRQYAGGLFTLMAVTALIVFGFRQRLKRIQAEREKREEILNQEIEFKKKELASQTLHLVQKSSFIQELTENLEKIKNSPDLFKMEFRKIVMLLKRENASDKDWQVFKSYFSEVHDNFDKKLNAIYQDITEKEIRLASFIRMKLSTKEIATMLNVLPDSVLKSKYRLKKKLNVEKDTDLYQYLSNL